MRMPGRDREWHRVLVYGLGLSGRAAAGLLTRRGVTVVGIDERGETELALGEAAELRALDGIELRLGVEPTATDAALTAALETIDAVVMSPGVPLDRPLLAAAREVDIPILAEVELAYAFTTGPVLGITGSNGKSTTTALTGALLTSAGIASEVCGNIGRPLSSCVDGPEGQVFVVELSSFQLEAVDRFHPRAAALLNLSPDHLDRHSDLDAYFAAKARIFARQVPRDVAVLNADDPRVAALACEARRRYFSRRGEVEDGCHLDGDAVVEREPGADPRVLFHRGDLPLAGVHNLENAMAAALLARACGAAPDGFAAALAAFRGLPHRMERVMENGGVVWIDDSKATNVGATVMSLAGFAPGSVHLILGGRGKQADLAPLAPAVERAARRVYLVGEAAADLERLLAGRVEIQDCNDVDRAVAAAAVVAQPGETVLLSPACASFDQFDNFAARGDHFQRLAREIHG